MPHSTRDDHLLRSARRLAAHNWEIVVGLCVSVAAMAAERHYHIFEWFVGVTRTYEAYRVDELLVLLGAGTVMLAIFAIRRSRALTAEVARRAASEARFAGLFAASPYPAGLFALDTGVVLDANEAALRAFGLPREGVVGRPMQELPFWDPDAADDLLRRIRAEDVVRNLEVTTARDSVNPHQMLVSAQAVELNGERCVVAAMSDITDQRAAERARDATAAELQSVFTAMRDIVLVLSRDGQYLEIPTTNADWLFGPAADLVGKNVHDVLPQFAADATCEVIRQALDDGAAVMMEYSLPVGDRDTWFSAVVTPLGEDRVVWVARDVTEELAARRALRESEAQYRLLFDKNPEPTFIISEEDFRYLDVNEAAVRHYGYSREEFLMMTAADLRPMDDESVFRAYPYDDWPAAERRLFRHRKHNGDVIDVEIARDTMLYRGRPARLILATDVTERLQASRRFERAFGDAPIGMVIASVDGRWIQVNTAICQLLGRPPEELLGASSARNTHPDDREQTRIILEQLRLGEERSVRLEKRYLHSSGRIVWTLTNATMMSGGGNTQFVILQVLDVTEQRAAVESLRRQALVFETMSEVVIVCEPDGRIIDVNPAAKAVFGYDWDELIGQWPSFWMRPEAAQSVFPVIGESIRTTGAWSGEYGFVAKDGRTGMVETTVRTLRDADGKVVNAIGVIRDVSERRQMERQLLQAQKLEAIGSLAAGIAHEINTPTQYVGDNVRFLGDRIAELGGAVQAARALADAARTPTVTGLGDAVAAFDRALLDVDMNYLMAELPLAAAGASEGVERIADIVRAVKSFAHPGGAEKQFVDLNAAVRDTLTVCRSEWKYIATVATDFDPDMPLVRCLPGELQQVVLILIVNAAQAIAEKRKGSGELGHIEVSTRHTGKWAEIRVRDDGHGIPESIRGNVFDPFFTTKAVGSGSGQGLTIGHATIVGRHQGTLTFESVEGCGTTFTICLPLDGGTQAGEAA